MRVVSLEELLEAGCHFGHQVTRHNPKSRDFVYEARDNIHIIDLAKTKEGLEEAARFVKSLAASGGSLVVVGTKRQARGIVEEEVKRARSASPSVLSSGSKDSGQAHLVNSDQQGDSIFFVTNRWIGGTLTNFSEVANNYRKLKDLATRLKDENEKAKYKKKEVGLWEKNRAKLESFYGGIADIKRIPDALFVIDTHLEGLAVSEARKMGATTIGIVDTNADPSLVDYPIPANDDAVGSIKLITNYIIDAWIEGSKTKGTEETKGTEGTREEKEKAKTAAKKKTKNGN